MPKITYIQTEGEDVTLDVDSGVNVMRAAISNSVPGIVGECGGSLMCATCHVYVDEDFTTGLPVPSEDEDEMLEVTSAERRPTSRLSCQISMCDEIDGLIVRVPESQG